MAQVPGTNAWIEHFHDFIEEEGLSEQWSLNFNYSIIKELGNQQRATGWKIYQTSAFGGFNCRCSNSWTSARVNILFHYRLRKGRGTVLIRPFKQKCRKCRNPPWLKPQVDSTQIDQVLDRLLVKILKNCYNILDVEDIDRPLRQRRTKPHESHLCEACQLGICSL